MRRRYLVAIAAVVVIGGVGVWLVTTVIGVGPPPTYKEQACSLPAEEWERIRRGHIEGRSGDISLLPRRPAYMASGAGGWSHSGPWDYLQEIPLVFYGPGFVEQVEVDRPVTLADVAPTLATLLSGSFRSEDGAPLEEVASLTGDSLLRDRPRLILVVVWDGGGWNTLEQWPDSWPNLRALMDEGANFTGATDGSSPSVTPAVHTTLGTGVFPRTHGITGIKVRDESGEIVDSFYRGESSRLIAVPALAERWDELNDNRALVGMIGYEPWHLGMIGQGAERPGGDRDDAVWLDVDTNEWITQPDHYRLHDSIIGTDTLQQEIDALDEADGRKDGAWGDHEILEDPSRIEETPAFVSYHGDVMRNLITEAGYGDDDVTDLLFTNFKQIDRVGHYFNMASEEVEEVLERSDDVLGELVDDLNSLVGPERWVMVVTADHGQQPDDEAVDGYGIDPTEVEADLRKEFGDVVHSVLPTDVFVRKGSMEESDVTLDEIAAYLGNYRLSDNTQGVDPRLRGAGALAPNDRLFALAVPGDEVAQIEC